jgi:hypothetical protein
VAWASREGLYTRLIREWPGTYTKYALYIATNKTTTAFDLAILTLRYVITEFGIPKGIVSDPGSVFTSNYWSCLCYAVSGGGICQ